jgi:hypothetical protein
MKYAAILCMTFLLASCGGGADEKKNEKTDDKDTTANADSNTTEPVEVEEAVENPTETSIEEFEKASEGGMSFCDCAKKIDELDQKMFATETDAEMEAVMAEKDKLVDGDCKVMKMGAQDSPDERAARMRKVKACLGK